VQQQLDEHNIVAVHPPAPPGHRDSQRRFEAESVAIGPQETWQMKPQRNQWQVLKAAAELN
jgi:hypothetical protein